MIWTGFSLDTAEITAALGGIDGDQIKQHMSVLADDKLEGRPEYWNQARSKRSRFITLSHAATKSRTNFSFASSHAWRRRAISGARLRTR